MSAKPAHSSTLSTELTEEESQKDAVGKIFIVDDEEMVTSSLQAMLTLETPHEVLAFNTPKQALEALVSEEPDIVISDFLMPDMDGIAFLKAVKEKLPETTLILLTGYADKENAIKAINTVGIYKYIEKPWNNEELKITLKNGLERSRLLSQLQQKITALSEARLELEKYSHSLESLVQERTGELTVTVQKLDSIVRGASDGIITVKPDLTINSVNPSAQKLFLAQLKEPDLIGQPVSHCLTVPKGPSVNVFFASASPQLIPEVLIGEVTVEVSISPIPKGEHFFPSQKTSVQNSVKTSVSALDDEVTENNGYVLIFRDISERKEVDRLRDDFVSTLTHDLRTPLLAAIQTLGFFSEGKTGDLNEKQQDIVTMMIHSNRDMLGLVNVLLEVYKYESGQQKLVIDKTDGVLLTQSIIKELTALAEHKQQTLKLNLNDDVCDVMADKQELKRVLVNLIGNAIHHSPSGTSIDIHIQKSTEAMLQFAVQDYGRGIPEKDIPHLFQRFSQGTSKVRSSGTGLGLYLSRQIIDAHNGRVWVESKEGEGTTFFFTLPVAQ